MRGTQHGACPKTSVSQEPRQMRASRAVRLAPEPSDKPSDNGPRQQLRLRTAPG